MTAPTGCSGFSTKTNGEHGSPLQNIRNYGLFHEQNNIRNGQEKSKRRIVRLKSEICEIKNISFEIQILPIYTICSRFCTGTQLFSGYRSDYRLIFALAMFNLDKNDGYVK